MGQVTVTLNGRTYRLGCGDGEEPRLLELAGHLEHCIDGLAAEFGQLGDERLLLMAALLIADELWEARERLALQGEDRTAMPAVEALPVGSQPGAPPDPPLASQRLGRIESRDAGRGVRRG